MLPLLRALPPLLCGTLVTLYLLAKPVARQLKPRSMLDGCNKVYVDVGTNIGVQIRKLYEVFMARSMPTCGSLYAHLWRRHMTSMSSRSGTPAPRCCLSSTSTLARTGAACAPWGSS